MQNYLSEQPNTLKQSKYSRDRSKKYEYRCCSYGCNFQLLIAVDLVNRNVCETRETPVPDSHDLLSEVVHQRHPMDKEVSKMIMELLEQNQFSKNFGPPTSYIILLVGCSKYFCRYLVRLSALNFLIISSISFGPKRIMSEVQRHNIAEERIPSQIQIQNKLSYYQQAVFNFNNEITPLQDKVRLSVFNGEEAADKPFVFVYDVDNTNRLVLIV